VQTVLKAAGMNGAHSSTEKEGMEIPVTLGDKPRTPGGREPNRNHKKVSMSGENDH